MLARWSVVAGVVALLVSSAVVAASAQRQPGTFKYSHTTQQTLADGTHITRTTHTATMRDAYGRTRNENESQLPGRPVMRSVNIFDPIAGVTYFYQEGEGQSIPHTYTRIEMHTNGQGVALRSMPPPSPVKPVVPVPAPTTVSASGITASAGGIVTSTVAGSFSPVPEYTAAMRPEVKNEDLGFDTVAGISCKSRRTTEIYPVNFFGNDRPITVTRENCIPTEGGMMVRNVSDDPRTGTQTMLLESVSYAEPAATLFQPPPDYTESQQNRPR